MNIQPKTFDQVQKEIEGKPIVIANRGIPARRISRSISECLNAVSIMTATDVDKTSPSTLGAFELLLLGDDPNAYLNLDLIIEKSKSRGAIAIHPGWGFIAENESFPAKCEEAGIIFIGPPTDAMRTLGNKVDVRRLAQQLGIPVVPGSEGAVTVEEAKEIAREIGFPVMLKAEGGGGGRGIYEIHSRRPARIRLSESIGPGPGVFRQSAAVCGKIADLGPPYRNPGDRRLSTAMSLPLTNATARFSATTRNWWKSRRPPGRK